MAYASTPQLLVLHTLRLKGFAEADALTASSGLDLTEVCATLDEVSASQLVVHREGRVTGWTLTPAGTARQADLVAEELDRAGARATVEDAYHRFLDINQDMLGVCTAWQIRDGGARRAVNDHTDPSYDAAVVGRLVDIHDRVRPVTADLRACLARYGRYGSRLRTSLERIVAGDSEWFTRPVIDSYHTVWFELHEDLLVTLGTDRTAESRAS